MVSSILSFRSGKMREWNVERRMKRQLFQYLERCR